MKNARFDEYIEAREAEPNSPNYDSVFSGMLELDSRVCDMSKKSGKKVDEIWGAIDVDPNTFFANYTEDKAKGKNEKEVYENLRKMHKDALFYQTDVMEQLDDFEKMLVPAEDMKYGGTAPKYNRKMTTFGAAMMVLGVHDATDILGGKRITTDGIPANKEAYPVKKAFDIIDYIIEHKKAISWGLLGLLGLYVGTAAVNANKKDGSDDTDANIELTEKQIIGAGAGIGGAASLFEGNASAVTATPTPVYDIPPKFTVVGSDEYKAHIEKQLENLDKEAPNFKIDGMTARQYVEKQKFYLYESMPGENHVCPKEAIGKPGVECLSKELAGDDNILHVARHYAQAYGDLKNKFSILPVYEHEKDAVDVQSMWIAARNNWTEDRRLKWFNGAMKQYKP